MKTLVVYLMAGQDTPALADAAVAGGADIVELGCGSMCRPSFRWGQRS